MASSSSFLLLLAIQFFSTTFAFCLDSNQNATTLDASSKDVKPESISPVITINQFVTAHNAARRLVGVPPLVWDPKLATYARVYARQRRRDCMLIHSPGYAYGENIFWGQGRRWSAADIVAAWVAEKQWYHYNSNSCSGPDCSHFTQIVWRTTKRVGCAQIVCNSGDTFSACEYFLPGNYIGARPYLRPQTSPPREL